MKIHFGSSHFYSWTGWFLLLTSSALSLPPPSPTANRHAPSSLTTIFPHPILVNQPYIYLLPTSFRSIPFDTIHYNRPPEKLPTWIHYISDAAFFSILVNADTFSTFQTTANSPSPSPTFSITLTASAPPSSPSLQSTSNIQSSPTLTLLFTILNRTDYPFSPIVSYISAPDVNLSMNQTEIVSGPKLSSYSFLWMRNLSPFAFTRDNITYATLFDPPSASNCLSFDPYDWTIRASLTPLTLQQVLSSISNPLALNSLSLILATWHRNTSAPTLLVYTFRFILNSSDVQGWWEANMGVGGANSSDSDSAPTVTASEQAITTMSMWGYLLMTFLFILFIILVSLGLFIRRRKQRMRQEHHPPTSQNISSRVIQREAFPSWESVATNTSVPKIPTRTEIVCGNKKYKQNVCLSRQLGHLKDLKLTMPEATQVPSQPQCKMLPASPLLSLPIRSTSRRLAKKTNQGNTLLSPFFNHIQTSEISPEFPFSTRCAVETTYLVARTGRSLYYKLPSLEDSKFQIHVSTALSSAPAAPTLFLEAQQGMVDKCNITSSKGQQKASFLALQQDGTPLPSWLNFDHEWAIFYGMPLKEHEGTLTVDIFETFSIPSARSRQVAHPMATHGQSDIHAVLVSHLVIVVVPRGKYKHPNIHYPVPL